MKNAIFQISTHCDSKYKYNKCVLHVFKREFMKLLINALNKKRLRYIGDQYCQNRYHSKMSLIYILFFNLSMTIRLSIHISLIPTPLSLSLSLRSFCRSKFVHLHLLLFIINCIFFLVDKHHQLYRLILIEFDQLIRFDISII